MLELGRVIQSRPVPADGDEQVEQAVGAFRPRQAGIHPQRIRAIRDDPVARGEEPDFDHPAEPRLSVQPLENAQAGVALEIEQEQRREGEGSGRFRAVKQVRQMPQSGPTVD